MREREVLFNDFLSDLRRKEKDEKHQKKEQVRKCETLNYFCTRDKNFTHLMAPDLDMIDKKLSLQIILCACVWNFPYS